MFSWEGDHFWTREISYRNNQVASDGPLGSEMARNAAIFIRGTVVGVTDPLPTQAVVLCAQSVKKCEFVFTCLCVHLYVQCVCGLLL